MLYSESGSYIYGDKQRRMVMHSKIFTSCCLGAFIGALVALQMHPAIWWIGMSVGAMIGYLTYEFKAVLVAIPRAYRAACGWRPDVPYWKMVAGETLALIGAMQTVICIFLILMYFNDPFAPDMSLVTRWKVITLGIGFLHGLVLLFGCMLIMTSDHLKNANGQYTRVLAYGSINPVSLLFWHLPRGIFFVVSCMVLEIPQALRSFMMLARFLKCFSILLFREVHSDARILCACDAAIGTAIGYFTGNAVIGGIAGGMFGVLNYELVSKRLLHLEVRP